MNRRKPVKRKALPQESVVKRVGANRQKHIEEQRAQRPRMVVCAIKTVSKIVMTAVIIIAAGGAVYMYSPAIAEHVSETVDVKKRLHTKIKITHCGQNTKELFQNALDSLIRSDSIFYRGDVMNIAAAIQEIEKVRVKKTNNRINKEKVTEIRVTERRPVAMFHRGDIFLVDKHGICFAARPGQYYDLPLLIINDDNAGDTVDLRIFYTIQKISYGFGGNFFKQISQIDISDGDVVNLYFKSGEAEYIIDFENIETRLHHVKKLRERLLEEPNVPVHRIDMRYNNLAFAMEL